MTMTFLAAAIQVWVFAPVMFLTQGHNQELAA